MGCEKKVEHTASFASSSAVLGGGGGGGEPGGGGGGAPGTSPGSLKREGRAPVTGRLRLRLRFRVCLR